MVDPSVDHHRSSSSDLSLGVQHLFREVVHIETWRGAWFAWWPWWNPMAASRSLSSSWFNLDQGLVNVQIEHHTTIGDIIFNNYLKVVSKKKQKGTFANPCRYLASKKVASFSWLRLFPNETRQAQMMWKSNKNSYCEDCLRNPCTVIMYFVGFVTAHLHDIHQTLASLLATASDTDDEHPFGGVNKLT